MGPLALTLRHRGPWQVALLFAIIAVLSVRVVWDDFRFEETSPGIGVPQWWYSVWLPVVSALITVRALGLFIRQGKPGAFSDDETTDTADTASKERT